MQNPCNCRGQTISVKVTQTGELGIHFFIAEAPSTSRGYLGIREYIPSTRAAGLRRGGVVPTQGCRRYSRKKALSSSRGLG